MKILPIGSIVKLNEGKIKLMIINRAPLQNKNGVIGYFDYSAVLYPIGQQNQEAYFFNQEDIKEVFHTGYIDEDEKQFQAEYAEKIEKAAYPKLKVVEP